MIEQLSKKRIIQSMTMPDGMHDPTPKSGPTEPIAIVGLSCRFSGIADSPAGLWEMLSRGQSGWTNNAKDRFNLAAFWHPKPELSGSFNPTGLHLMNQDPAVFDSEFFGINGVEAKAIDPHHRLLLEVAYEAFENAGMGFDELEGSRTGVYCAVPYQDYEQIQGRDPETSPGYRFTGTGPGLMSNRVSYAFDLRGPSVSIDTACSSTVVALNEACKDIHLGNTTQALVGGANLLIDPDKSSVISAMQFLSTHGRCHSFDSRGTGYGRGEGVAAVILKPLNAALRDGDTIRSVIRGCAITSDGRTPGITMPCSDRQIDTIRLAYKAAGLDPRETAYVEAHGTGTKVGDKAEAEAFARTFCEGRQKADGLYVGSVKSNLGHLENTSGLPALIKLVLMLERGVIVPNPTFKFRREDLDLEGRGICVAEEAISWPEQMKRRASLNSTGYGGTNAHLIVDGPLGYLPDASKAIEHHASEERPRLFVLTHRQDERLGVLAQRLKKHLSKEPVIPLDSLAFTLCSKRSHFNFRSSITAATREELLEGLGRIEEGVERSTKAVAKPCICFVFTGQGAQWACMGLGLLQSYPVFAQSLYAAEEALIGFGASWGLLSELSKTKESSRINEAELAQPCTTAIQIALIDLLESWGVTPHLVCGHSSGEIVAAYAAGVLTSQDALRVAYFRGSAAKLLKAMNPGLNGGMLAVGLSESDARPFVETEGTQVGIACINSPSSVTLSGDRDALQRLQKPLNEKGIFNRLLAVDVAYHSYHMERVSQFYASTLHSITPRKVKEGVHFVSSVTGEPVRGDEMDLSYWVRNLLSPVRFTDALIGVLEAAFPGGQMIDALNCIVEIGPHSALRGPILEIVRALNLTHLATYENILRRGESAATTSLSLAGNLFSHGVTVDFGAINNPRGTFPNVVMTDLPSYNWNHKTRHWNESRRSTAYRFRKFPRHDLLGSPVMDYIDAQPMWRNYLRVSELPWLKDHLVQGQMVFPSTGYITMTLEALKQQAPSGNHVWRGLCVHFRDVVINRPLLIPDDSTGVETFIELRPASYSAHRSSENWREFRIMSCTPQGESTEHCWGLIEAKKVNNKLNQEPYRKGTNATLQSMDVEKWYDSMWSLGCGLSGPFASLSEISAGDLASRCSVTIPDVKSSMPSQHQESHCIHPATLDSCFQSSLPGLQAAGKLHSAAVVTAIHDLKIMAEIASEPGQDLAVENQVEQFGIEKYSASLVAFEGDCARERPLIQAKGLIYTVLDSSRETDEDAPSQPLCHRLEWGLDPSCSPTASVLNRGSLTSGSHPQHHLKRVCDPFCRSIITQTVNSLTVTDQDKVSGYRKHLLNWMRSVRSDSALPVTDEAKDHTRAAGAVGEWVVHVGCHLGQIVLGEVEPLKVFMHNDLLHRVYFEDENSARCNAQLASWAKLAHFKNPGMRILEVGAGTGSLTLPFIEALYNDNAHPQTSANWGRFVFTDISTGFMSRARERLAKYERFIDFQKLDIENPPEAQGFALGSFDLIIGSNVIHATERLTQSLANLRSLLKPGGQLAFVEITNPSLRWGFYGALSGWWAGVDEGRVSSPLLKPDDWSTVLRDSGFSGVSLEIKDYETEVDHEMSVLVSTALPETKPRAEEVVIVNTAESTELSDRLASLISRDDECAALQSHLLEAQPGHRAFIMLLETASPFWTSPSKAQWDKVRDITSQAHSVLWVTRGGAVEYTDPHRSLISGLARTLRSERKELNLVCLDLDPNATSSIQDAADICRIYSHVFANCKSPLSATEYEFAIRNNEVLVPRLIVDDTMNNYIHDSTSNYHPKIQEGFDKSRHLELKIRNTGLPSSLYWDDSTVHSAPLTPDQVQVEMRHISLNDHDMMTATGQLEGLSNLLIEGSGVVSKVGEAAKKHFSVGDSVCAIGPDGLALKSNLNYQNLFPVPNGVDLQAAAAIPIPYATAIHSLKNVANVQSGDSILIHSAAEAVGQAMVVVARYLGAEHILVTVASDEEREFIKERYDIPDEDVFSNRDSDFDDQIMLRTNQQGVDVVVNSLTGDIVRQSCAVLAPFGRLIEIEKTDILKNARLETKYLARNRSFAVVDLIEFIKHKPRAFADVMKCAYSLIQNSKDPIIEPISAAPISEIEESLRVMHAGENKGKVVMDVLPDLPLKVQPPHPKPAAMDGNAAYVVLGGVNGLGGAMVQFLAKSGAKHIITLSPSGSAIHFASLANEMKTVGVKLTILEESASGLENVQSIRGAAHPHSVRGVIGASDQGSNEALGTMSYENWRDGTDQRIAAITSMEQSLPGLDFFIMLSSCAGTLGSSGHGLSAASCAFQCAYARHCAGTKSTVRCIDVGTTTDSIKKNELFALLSHAVQPSNEGPPTQAHLAFDIAHPHPDSGAPETTDLRVDARFSHIYTREAQPERAKTERDEHDFQHGLRSAETPTTACEMTYAALKRKVSELLAIPEEGLDASRPVATYGVDSLISVELRNWVSSYLDSRLEMYELMGPLAMVQLAELIARRSRLVRAGLFGETKA
ncbi:hypothetical protein AWENTII_011083 [Aspergillus wentii]